MTKHETDEAKIRETAYQIWIDEGQPEGRDEEHWLRAIEMLNAARPAANKVRKAPAKPRSKKAAVAPKSAAARSAKAKPAVAAKKSVAAKSTKTAKP